MRRCGGFRRLVVSLLPKFPLRAIAFTMALILNGCMSQPSGSGVRVFDCDARWTRDGFDHYRLSVKNDGQKAINATTILLGNEGGIPEQGTDNMSSTDFTKLAAAMLPFGYVGVIEPGESRKVEVETTKRREAQFIGPLSPRRASCVVSEVTYSDGTRWSHNLHIGFTGLQAPYFVQLQNK